MTKYQSNFDSKATQDILDRTTLLKEFIISLDYDNMADTFQDDLYNLVDKLALSVRSAFLTILTGFDGLTGMTRDPTPEIALDRSKVASVSLFLQILTLLFCERILGLKLNISRRKNE